MDRKVWISIGPCSLRKCLRIGVENSLRESKPHRPRKLARQVEGLDVRAKVLTRQLRILHARDGAAYAATTNYFFFAVAALRMIPAHAAASCSDANPNTAESTREFRLLHTMLRVRDLEKSLDFYTRLLGMTLLRRNDYEGGRFTLALPGTPPGEAFNVGQMYALFAQAIRDRSIGGDIRQPDFATAVELHHIVDAIKRASDEGREATFA